MDLKLIILKPRKVFIMSKFVASILGIAFFALAVTLAITGCSGVFNTVADTVLANEVRFDDREPPRTAYAISASADPVQVLGGQGNGLSCSLPWGAQTLAFTRTREQAPIALQMRQACAFHDYCYRHGNATYGYSQADCDFMLQQQAFRLCKYIDADATNSDCETNARKVTLGVRLGGFGSFKSARAPEDEKASTFMEFDPYPVRANSNRVIRVADAPGEWVRDGLLPKAAYQFDIRPSGSLVHVLGWKRDGNMVCSSFELPASYAALNGPPMVVRDTPRGEDWFVWWKRDQLSNTGGSFAVLSPGRATREDWVEVAGGMTRYSRAPACEYKALWRDNPTAIAPALTAFTNRDRDLGFSELHPVKGADTPGLLRLMGLSTHSCGGGMGKPCVVSVVFDTHLRQVREEPAGRYRYSLPELDCGGKNPNGTRKDTCDRYRHYVGAPFVNAHASPPSLIWMRRGTGNGEGYERTADVLHYSIGKPGERVATDLGETVLTDFSEEREPAFIADATAAHPTFVSVTAGKGGVEMLTQTPALKGQQSTQFLSECMRNAPVSWLQRPTYLVEHPEDARVSYMVFSRVRLGDGQNPLPVAELNIAVATLTDGKCSGPAVRESTFTDFFKGFATQEKQADTQVAPADRGLEPMRRYAERVRGGQMVLADITGDGIPDLVQVAQVPGDRQIRIQAGVLVGSIDGAGLRFSEFAGRLP